MDQPEYRPSLPGDPTTLPFAEVRRLLFQFTEIYRWAEQTIGIKRAQVKLLKTQLDNSIRFAQTGAGRGSMAQRERQVKIEHIQVVNKLADMEADILALEGLAVGFNAAREVLSREITSRIKE